MPHAMKSVGTAAQLMYRSICCSRLPWPSCATREVVPAFRSGVMRRPFQNNDKASELKKHRNTMTARRRENERATRDELPAVVPSGAQVRPTQ